jgi:hypothetical protein
MNNLNQNVISNQEQVFIHLTLRDDLAYQYSVTNSDVRNMQMVLRAYKEAYTIEAAEQQIAVAKDFN